MHAKFTKWAWWAFTIAIVQHLILTANADLDSENGFGSISKRSSENGLEERFLEIKKFAYDTGSTPNKRSPIYRVNSVNIIPNSYGAYLAPHPGYRRWISSIVERFTSLKKRAPISWGNGQNAYFFGPKCTGKVCHRSLSSIGGLATSLVKRSPIFMWTPKSTKYFAGASCQHAGCRRDVQMVNEESHLKKRSPLPSNIEDPNNSGFESNIASMRSTLDDLAEEMTMTLLRKRFKFQFFPNFFRLFPGSHRRRQNFDSDDDFTNILTKRWGIPWWLNRFAPSGGGSRRQVLESDEELNDMLTKRWGAPPWWLTRFMPSGGGSRRQVLESDEDLKVMLAKRFWTHARKLRDGLDFESEDILNEKKRLNKDNKKMLFTERWIDDVESYDETIEQVKRSPILGPLIMYWTMPMRRSLKDEAQFVKREPFWANFFAYKPGSHRRSSEAEEERDVGLVKRSPIWKGKAPYFSAPPRRSTSEGTETVTTSENILKKREEHNVEEKVNRELASEQQFGENVESNLIKREPVFRWNRNGFAPPKKRHESNLIKREPIFRWNLNSFAPPPKKRQNERDESNLIKREPVFRIRWKSYMPAPPRKKREIEENANIEKREVIVGNVIKREFGQKRRQLEKPIKREVFETQAKKEEQFSKRSPIFRPKGTGYYGTQKGKTTKRSLKTGELSAIVKRAEDEEQLSKRTPIFKPKGTGYMGPQNTKNVK